MLLVMVFRLSKKAFVSFKELHWKTSILKSWLAVSVLNQFCHPQYLSTIWLLVSV